MSEICTGLSNAVAAGTSAPGSEGESSAPCPGCAEVEGWGRLAPEGISVTVELRDDRRVSVKCRRRGRGREDGFRNCCRCGAAAVAGGGASAADGDDSGEDSEGCCFCRELLAGAREDVNWSFLELYKRRCADMRSRS